MKTFDLGNGWMVRLDPGDEFIKNLKTFATERKIKFAAILSGVGMIKEASMGFFCVSKNDYDEFKLNNGPYDLSSVSGNISLLENQAWPHLHVVVNTKTGETFSGHVLRATCHITAEIFIANFSEIPIIRRREPNLPASRLDYV